MHQVCKVFQVKLDAYFAHLMRRGALCDEQVVYTCILYADSQLANEDFVQTMCTLYLPKSMATAQVTLIVYHSAFFGVLWCL